MPPSTPATPARNAPRKNEIGEDDLDVDPERRDHLPVVDARAHDHPEAGALDHGPEREPDRDRRQQHEDAEERIRDVVEPQLDGLGPLLGGASSCAIPPKWASAWSAMMTEIAIVISAWRSSCPWFQRRKTCCIEEPEDPDRERRDRRSGNDPVREAGLRAAEGRHGVAAGHPLLQLEGEEAGEHEERAVRHVDDAHQAEDQREAARDDEVEAGEREAVEADDHERPRILLRLVGDPDEHRVRRRPRRGANGQRPRGCGDQTLPQRHVSPRNLR